jgi:hypothetical protein
MKSFGKELQRQHFSVMSYGGALLSQATKGLSTEEFEIKHHYPVLIGEPSGTPLGAIAAVESFSDGRALDF